MSRLADGRHLCPRCGQTYPEDEMRAPDRAYCLPCNRAAHRESHRNRQALRGIAPPRVHRDEPPADLAANAPGRTDEMLAAMYDVCERTIRNWRKALGIKPGRRTNRPADFDAVARNMTMPEVVARWGVHEGTAYRWLRELRGIKPPQGYARPVPADWAEVCSTRHGLATAQHYGVSRNTVSRWARVSGISPLVGKPGGPRRDRPAPVARAAKPAAKRVNLTLRASPRPLEALVTPIREGCMDCTPTRLCRACQASQVQADIDAWLAAGNRPHEVPVGVSGRAA